MPGVEPIPVKFAEVAGGASLWRTSSAGPSCSRGRPDRAHLARPGFAAREELPRQYFFTVTPGLVGGAAWRMTPRLAVLARAPVVLFYNVDEDRSSGSPRRCWGWSMRWVNSWLAAALCLGLCACGDYPTEDLRFLAAVPSRAPTCASRSPRTRSAIPASRARSCATRPADTWLRAKPESDRLNAAVEFLLGLVDVVRRAPPDWRAEDARGWGLFPDEKHPGRETRVTILCTYPAGAEGPPAFAYAFEARVTGGGAWTTVLAGAFEGASASRGKGTLFLDFDALWTLERPTASTPPGAMGSSTTAPRSR